VVPVNVDYPEDNEPVFIVRFKNYQHRDADYTGYDIQVFGELGEFDLDMHVMKFTQPTELGNTITYTKSSWPLSALRDVAAYEQKETIAEVKTGHSQARASYKDGQESRGKKECRLEFPAGSKLTNDPFRSLTSSGERLLECKLFPIRYDTGRTDIKGKKIMDFSCRCSWKVIDLSTKEAVDAGKREGLGKSQLDSAFAGLDLSAD